MRSVLRSVTIGTVIMVAALIGLKPINANAEWPEQPIEFVCATGPSSSAAVWCRLFAELTSKELGQHVEVLFKGGGGGNTAAEYVVSKPADGYTWLQRNTSYAGYMSMPTFRPDPMEFEVILEIEKFLYVMGVRADSKYKTWLDVIEDMKANPGKVAVAGNKPGSVHHVHMIKLFKAFGIDDFGYVPYAGSGAAMKDVLGGHIPLGIIPYGIWAPHVESGDARSLLLINEEEYDRIPLPIPKDSGQDYEIAHQVQGLFVKVGTPKDIEEKIQAAWKKAVETDRYKEYIETNAHVIPQFNDNTEVMTENFHQIRKETEQFLKDSGLIE